MSRKRAPASNRVGIADLKMRLSEHLRTVRAGAEIIVMDRDKPVARIQRYQEQPPLPPLRYREAKAPFNTIKQLKEPLDLGFDIVDVLLEDRKKR